MQPGLGQNKGQRVRTEDPGRVNIDPEGKPRPMVDDAKLPSSSITSALEATIEGARDHGISWWTPNDKLVTKVAQIVQLMSSCLAPMMDTLEAAPG